MLIRYLVQFLVVCAILPLVLKAATTCDPYRLKKFVTHKAENGSALCAESTPTETTAADFKILCVNECLNRASCGDGFNYRSEAKVCELYLDQPTTYEVHPDCDYLMVKRCLFLGRPT